MRVEECTFPLIALTLRYLPSAFSKDEEILPGIVKYGRPRERALSRFTLAE